MQSISTYLPPLLRLMGSRPERCLLFLQELWPSIVGKGLALQCRPVALTGKVLLVAVPSGIWRSELGGMKALIRESVNRFWDCRLVETIDLKIDPNF